jgi:hypothetical protein
MTIFNSYAQSEVSRPHAISVEIYGRGLLYSLNYDYSINDSVTVGGGFSTYSLSYNSASIHLTLLPLYVNYYFQPGPHRGFLSGGGDIAIASGSIGGNATIRASGFFPVLGGGYEFRPDNGFIFRAAPYLFIGNEIEPWIGLSAGVTF